MPTPTKGDGMSRLRSGRGYKRTSYTCCKEFKSRASCAEHDKHFQHAQFCPIMRHIVRTYARANSFVHANLVITSSRIPTHAHRQHMLCMLCCQSVACRCVCCAHDVRRCYVTNILIYSSRRHSACGTTPTPRFSQRITR